MTTIFQVRELDQRRATPFELAPPPAQMSEIARTLDLSELRKLRFTGKITPEGQAGWAVTATLGATVVQPCVATLAPVTTRIDDAVERLFVPVLPDTPEDDEGVEIVDDERLELLGDRIDIAAIMIESLALALPQYPRAADAEGVSTKVAPPGVEPMSDEETRPFAGLAALRDKLKGPS